MAKALNKSQIASAIADQNNLTKKQAVEILEQLAGLAYKHAKDSFTIPDLGKLALFDRKAQVGRNPATGEMIQIKAKEGREVSRVQSGQGRNSRPEVNSVSIFWAR